MTAGGDIYSELQYFSPLGRLSDGRLVVVGGCLLGTFICRQGKLHGLLTMPRTATRYASVHVILLLDEEV